MTKPQSPAAPKDFEFAYKNVGFGCVTYEKGDKVIGLKDGRLRTRTFDSEGLQWDGQRWKFDAGLGLVTSIVPLTEVPEEDRADW